MLNDQSLERSWTSSSVTGRSGNGVAFVEASHEVLLGYEGDGGTTGEVVLDVHANLGGVSHETLSLDSGTANGGSDADDTSVDSARDTVGLLDVDLGEVEVFLIVGVVLLDISSGGTIDHVSHLESLDGLILTDASTAVDTSDSVGVALVVLTTTVVSSLRWHF